MICRCLSEQANMAPKAEEKPRTRAAAIAARAAARVRAAARDGASARASLVAARSALRVHPAVAFLACLLLFVVFRCWLRDGCGNGFPW